MEKRKNEEEEEEMNFRSYYLCVIRFAMISSVSRWLGLTWIWSLVIEINSLQHDNHHYFLCIWLLFLSCSCAVEFDSGKHFKFTDCCLFARLLRSIGLLCFTFFPFSSSSSFIFYLSVLLLCAVIFDGKPSKNANGVSVCERFRANTSDTHSKCF